MSETYKMLSKILSNEEITNNSQKVADKLEEAFKNCPEAQMLNQEHKILAGVENGLYYYADTSFFCFVFSFCYYFIIVNNRGGT